MSPCSRQTLLNGLAAFFASFSDFTGYETFLEARAEDAHHSLYPSSLGIPTRLNNTELLGVLETALPGLTDFKPRLDKDFPIVADEPNCSVSFRYLAEGQYDGGLYDQEYFQTFVFTDNAEKILESWEMLDPTKIQG